MTAFEVAYAVITYTACVFSVLMNIAPIVTIIKLEKAGTVGAGTITFFGAQLYNCVTWASYGAFNISFPLLIPNTLGNCVSTYSILTFLTLARKEERAGKKLPSTTYSKSVLTAVFFVVISWAHLFICIVLLLKGNGDVARSFTGWEGSVACVVMLSAPLGVFKTIIQTRNAESLQPLMVTFAFFNTLLWSIAGFMRADPFLIIPNLLSFVACAAQVVLLLKYGRKPPEAESTHEAVALVPFD